MTTENRRMLLTVTNISKSPQRVASVDAGFITLGPGEGLTGEFDETQVAYIRSCPGHFSLVGGDDAPVGGVPGHDHAPVGGDRGPSRVSGHDAGGVPGHDDEWTHPVAHAFEDLNASLSKALASGPAIVAKAKPVRGKKVR